ncbi:Thylakoid lumenal 19 kDa protein, chloroplastic [Linum grandiflorum]
MAATTVTTSAISASAAATNPKPPPQKTIHPQFLKIKSLTATIAATAILTTTPFPSLASEPSSSSSYTLYYGTAASAANYGGYGGNSDKKASAEYTYDVPQGWKERLVSKVEKGTNGTDSEFFNPKKKTEKEYLTFLSGFRTLAPRDAVLDNLALSDVELQDLIAGAEKVTSEEKKDEENGQVYYEYEIDGVGKHSLIKVTCARNKLYAHFVIAPAVEWDRDQDTLRHLHQSFKTVG